MNSVSIVSSVLVILLSVIVILARLSYKSKNEIDTISLIEKYGYICKIHYITTEDGYILTVHRLSKHDKEPKKGPVLVVHGLVSSSVDFVSLGPEKSLGYILCDQGYDVWLANVRGTTYSTNHTKLDPVTKPKDFWDFSWHEIGIYDVPAMIDHILNETQMEQLFYIGLSQGCTTFFAMASTLPEYNKKIRLAVHLAPGVIYSNIICPTALVPLCKLALSGLELFSNTMQIYEFPLRKVYRPIIQLFCTSKFKQKQICEFIFSPVLDDRPQVDKTILPVLVNILPDTASLRQPYHYLQLRLSEKFQKYDYGGKGNILKYGQSTPPEYDLTNVDSPIALYYGKADKEVIMKDVETLDDLLHTVVKKYLVPNDDFNHIDFLYAKDVKSLVYDDVIALMDTYQNKLVEFS